MPLLLKLLHNPGINDIDIHAVVANLSPNRIQTANIHGYSIIIDCGFS